MSFLNQLASGAAAVADKLDDPKPAAPTAGAAAPAPAAPAAGAPAAAAPAAGAPAAAAPAAGAPAAGAPAAPATGEAPVDIKATLMHAADAAKHGNYMGAVQDVMKTGLVQKLAASQGKPHGDQAAAGGSGDLVGNLMQQAGGLLGGGASGAGGAGGAGGANPLGGLLGALGGAGDAKPAAPAAPPAK